VLLNIPPAAASCNVPVSRLWAGLAIGHPAIIYDNATDLYWMASNMNRDSTRRWRQPWQPTLPKLHITPFSKCEVGLQSWIKPTYCSANR
jgi:hypothetical protein